MSHIMRTSTSAVLPLSAEILIVLMPQHADILSPIVSPSTCFPVHNGYYSALRINLESSELMRAEHHFPSTNMLTTDSATFKSGQGMRLVLMSVLPIHFPGISTIHGPVCNSDNNVSLCLLTSSHFVQLINSNNFQPSVADDISLWIIGRLNLYTYAQALWLPQSIQLSVHHPSIWLALTAE